MPEGEIRGGSCNASVWQPVDELDILELSESGVGIFHTFMGLGRKMGKELDLKLTMGMNERR